MGTEKGDPPLSHRSQGRDGEGWTSAGLEAGAARARFTQAKGRKKVLQDENSKEEVLEVLGSERSSPVKFLVTLVCHIPSTNVQFTFAK